MGIKYQLTSYTYRKNIAHSHRYVLVALGTPSVPAIDDSDMAGKEDYITTQGCCSANSSPHSSLRRSISLYFCFSLVSFGNHCSRYLTIRMSILAGMAGQRCLVRCGEARDAGPDC